MSCVRITLSGMRGLPAERLVAEIIGKLHVSTAHDTIPPFAASLNAAFGALTRWAWIVHMAS